MLRASFSIILPFAEKFFCYNINSCFVNRTNTGCRHSKGFANLNCFKRTPYSPQNGSFGGFVKKKVLRKLHIGDKIKASSGKSSLR